jgi:hypothetical protein
MFVSFTCPECNEKAVVNVSVELDVYEEVEFEIADIKVSKPQRFKDFFERLRVFALDLANSMPMAVSRVIERIKDFFSVNTELAYNLDKIKFELGLYESNGVLSSA